MNIAEIKGLSMSVYSGKGVPTPILDNISFHIREGEILGLIGNSGSGKSMTAMTLAGLLPESAHITSGSIVIGGREVLTLSPKERRKLLGEEIGIIFQDPMTALDPLQTVGKNLDEILRIRNVAKEERYDRIVSMLKTVGFIDPEGVYKRYPHQISGGQRQRVLIAGAALLKPKILIADEPTSSLDTVTTASILKLLKEICVSMHMTILFISHDLSVVNDFCDRVMVIKEGRIVESDTTEDILHNPKNAYTAELLTKANLDPRSLGLTFSSVDYSASPVLSVSGISSGYSNGFFGGKKRKDTISDISFELFPGEVMGLIGSSGCGKTTLAKTLCGLIKPNNGKIDLGSGRIGVVFQDPVSCLNPMHTIRWHLREALSSLKTDMTKKEKEELIVSTIKSVGLEEHMLDRLPGRMSGGQRQRAAIAMCLILEPSVIIADEPFSSLDTTSAASILKLLSKINLERKTTILLISHNLRVVRTMCKRVMVMSRGKVVEEGMTKDVLIRPSAEATKALIKAEIKPLNET
ncbi:MAG: ABC transporter ATP-binding protein [Clostridiales bacterium]|nr:ABC transporter ATP-binding protein [Clostridiales bacterium]HAW15593.1 ABC transporter ATP-binding protein [Clostridiales bacterium]